MSVWNNTMDTLSALRHGENPVTGEELPFDHFLKHPKVQKALSVATEQLCIERDRYDKQWTPLCTQRFKKR